MAVKVADNKINVRNGFGRGQQDFGRGDQDFDRDGRGGSGSDRRRAIIAAAAVLIIIAVVVLLMRRFASYGTYTVSWQKDLSQGSLAGYEPFGDGFLKYSKDGVTCLNGRGTETWVDTYEMKSPVISVNGSFAVIADSQGNEVRIYGSEGKVGQTTTQLPLLKAAVSRTGITAVIEEDASSSYIYFLNKDGSSLDVSIRSILSGDGYPTSLALSPDGTRLMVGFEYLSGGVMRGRVVFYDFSEIGKNIPNRLVGGFDEPFGESLIADVQYLDGTYSFSASTKGLCFFSSRNLTSPELVKQVDETDEIRSLFYNDSYVGVIMNNSTGEGRYRLELYKPDGTKVMEKIFDDSYLNASVDGDYVFVFSSNSGMILNTAGVEKFRGALDFQVLEMRQGTVPGEFLMAGPTNLKGVRLR